VESQQEPRAEHLVVAAVYRREVAASLTRIWENVLDWEHLPWLHARSFVGIDLERASADGFRARVSLPPAAAPRAATLEVRLDRPGLRYLTVTVDGLGAGTRIWTRLEPVAERRTRIAVEFHLPGALAGSDEQARAIGAFYLRLYTQLWDEDEAMMVRRQAVLDARPIRSAARARLSLGPVAALRPRLPLIVEAAGEHFRVVDLAGALLAHTVVCPHLGGPLEAATSETDGSLTCPWHGYRFDLRTGRSCDGRGLVLRCAPRIEVDAGGEAALVWSAA